MILKIYKYGESVLREKATAVAKITPAVRKLADDMLDTMHKARGVGLAAQQVGHRERLCVIDIPDGCENDFDAAFNAPVQMPLIMFNPQILAQEGSQRDKEGCLSFPEIGGSLVRAAQVTATFIDQNGLPQTITARGFLARAIQHELDHLDGVLYIDHMSAVERLAFAPKLRKLASRNGGAR